MARKNMRRNADGNWVNQFGVVFTPEERKAFERNVAKINRLNARQQKESDPLPRRYAGKNKEGSTVAELRLMGKAHNEMIITKRSKNLQRFSRKEDFEVYAGQIAYIAEDPKGYVDDKTRYYKRNYCEALIRTYGEDETADIRMKIRMMKPEQFRNEAMSNEELEFSFIDSDGVSHGNLNQIRAALGMKLKEDKWGDSSEFNK